MNNKAISPVVATALLLVVAVVAVVAFQTWFNNFQSGQLSDVEQRANAGAALTVERLEANSTDATIYIKNAGTDTITITSVSAGTCTDPTGVTATASNVTSHTLAPACASLTDGVAYDVVLVTTDGVFSANLLAR